MRKSVWMLALSFILACQGTSFAASTVDLLVRKLVEKGILTEKEATELKGEIIHDEKIAQEDSSKKSIPEWIQNTKLTGDFRIRNQAEHRINNASSGNGRDRARIRARLGFETKINDAFKMSVGIASDGGSARSNNQTLTGNFVKGNVVLNYAYGQWVPNDKFSLTAGQMKNPIWEPMELLWDSDITPTGGAAEYNYEINDYLTLTSMGGVFVVNELSQSNADPYILVGQFGGKGKLGKKIDYKVIGTYQNVQNNTKGQFQTSSFNSISSSKYIYRYNTPIAGAELGLNDPLGKDSGIFYLPRLAVFGEYVKNPNPSDENTAWMLGLYVGHSKVSGKGDWKLTGAYKTIGRDAWIDILPDSDFYGGSTDVQGYESILEYGLAKNITFAVDFYRTQRKASLAPKNPEYLLQTDLNWRF